MLNKHNTGFVADTEDWDVTEVIIYSLPQPAKPHRPHSGGRRIIVSDGNHQQGRKMALKETQVISAGKIGFEFVRNIALPPLTSGDRE